jgi:hypothetical protein
MHLHPCNAFLDHPEHSHSYELIDIYIYAIPPILIHCHSIPDGLLVLLLEPPHDYCNGIMHDELAHCHITTSILCSTNPYYGILLFYPILPHSHSILDGPLFLLLESPHDYCNGIMHGGWSTVHQHLHPIQYHLMLLNYSILSHCNMHSGWSALSVLFMELPDENFVICVICGCTMLQVEFPH